MSAGRASLANPGPLAPATAQYASFGKSISDLLQAISKGWGWKIGKPVEVVATNQFGNAIVRNEEGSYFRIMPEEWQCEFVASSAAELERKGKAEEFIRDWGDVSTCLPRGGRARAARRRSGLLPCYPWASRRQNTQRRTSGRSACRECFRIAAIWPNKWRACPTAQRLRLCWRNEEAEPQHSADRGARRSGQSSSSVCGGWLPPLMLIIQRDEPL